MIARGRQIRCLWVYASENEPCSAMRGIMWELQRKVRRFHQSAETFWLHNGSIVNRNLVDFHGWKPPVPLPWFSYEICSSLIWCVPQQILKIVWFVTVSSLSHGWVKKLHLKPTIEWAYLYFGKWSQLFMFPLLIFSQSFQLSPLLSTGSIFSWLESEVSVSTWLL